MKNRVKNTVTGKRKGTNLILCGVIISFLVAVGGCSKVSRIDLDGIKKTCECINEDSIADKTIPVINDFLANLLSNSDEESFAKDEKQLQELVTWLKWHFCIIDASILHISGIYTGIPMSEILILFEENGVTKELVLDILMSNPLQARVCSIR